MNVRKYCIGSVCTYEAFNLKIWNVNIEYVCNEWVVYAVTVT